MNESKCIRTKMYKKPTITQPTKSNIGPKSNVFIITTKDPSGEVSDCTVTSETKDHPAAKAFRWSHTL
ncbi:hypothetical protein PVK06_049380 [Gossypium arboreum]|uniref:Uncharacterized protein n=1 Tax=Gossypium arboreum TaxID=29729 RepID=A0ABR0MIH2_GOSAR|nr:hypothetical protein PVK06_049380 [Gossypium arboreum]